MRKGGPSREPPLAEKLEVHVHSDFLNRLEVHVHSNFLNRLEVHVHSNFLNRLEVHSTHVAAAAHCWSCLFGLVSNDNFRGKEERCNGSRILER